jgi:hypothetical protein
MKWRKLRTIAACCPMRRTRYAGSRASFDSIGEVANTGMARDTDLAGDLAPALGDVEALTRVDVSAVQAEARTPGGAVVGGSRRPHWRQLLSLV